MGYQNTNSQLINALRAHANFKKGVIPIDTEDLKRVLDLAEIAIKSDERLETKGCELPAGVTHQPPGG
jgi:hypothetical protein